MEDSKNLVPTKISVENLPSIISSTLSDISDVDKKIRDAVTKAAEAKQSADIASNKNAGWSFFGKDKKEAIEALQKAAVNQANALTDTVDANKELFDNQKKMTQAIMYLFGLGVANMAANRTVVRELELKLKNASKEELSELARQELANVILQLRAQEDVQNRIDGHDKLFREHREDLNSMNERISPLEKKCAETLDNLKRLDENLTSKIKNLNDSLHDEKSAVEKLLDGHNKLFREHREDLNSMNERIAPLEKKCAETLDNLKRLDENLTSKIKNLNDSLHDEKSAVEKLLEYSVNEKVSKQLSIIEPRIVELEDFKRKEIVKKTFCDSIIYKISVGLIAIAALLCSILM